MSINLILLTSSIVSSKNVINATPSDEDIKFETAHRLVEGLIWNEKERDLFTFVVDCGDVKSVPVLFQYQLSKEHTNFVE